MKFRVLARLFVLALSVSASAAPNGAIEATKAFADPYVNVVVTGDAAKVIYDNLADKGDMRPGATTKQDGSIICTAAVTYPKMTYTCIFNIDQLGRFGKGLIK